MKSRVQIPILALTNKNFLASQMSIIQSLFKEPISACSPLGPHQFEIGGKNDMQLIMTFKASKSVNYMQKLSYMDITKERSTALAFAMLNLVI
jgi:hypothetical protein